jgi:hypothetical protein
MDEDKLKAEKMAAAKKKVCRHHPWLVGLASLDGYSPFVIIHSLSK